MRRRRVGDRHTCGLRDPHPVATAAGNRAYRRRRASGSADKLPSIGADVATSGSTTWRPQKAKLSWEDGRLEVRDLGSRNGTWVFLEAPHRLMDGEQFLIGSQVIRFRRLGYPGPHAADADRTKRVGSLVPSADIASLTPAALRTAARGT